MASILDFNSIFNQMLNAAKSSLGEKFPTIRDLATTSIKTIAQNIIDIEEMNVSGAITQEQALLMIGMQKNAFKIVLLSEEGLGLLAVEAALNAALDAVKTAVNTAIGFALL